MANSDSDDSDSEFDSYDPEVLAANGIYDPPIGDAGDRMMLKWWIYRMKFSCNLRHRMIVPPLGVLKYPDLLEKAWGWWWTLLPVYTCLDQDLPLYKEYLCEYYIRNPPESVDGAVAATEETGVVLQSAWTNKKGRLIPLARLLQNGSVSRWRPSL